MFDTNNTLKEKGFGMSVDSRDETRGKPFTWGTTAKKQIPYPKNKYHCWVSVAKLILLAAHLQIIFDMTILDPCSWLELIGHECRACRRVRCKLERVVWCYVISSSWWLIGVINYSMFPNTVPSENTKTIQTWTCRCSQGTWHSKSKST